MLNTSEQRRPPPLPTPSDPLVSLLRKENEELRSINSQRETDAKQLYDIFEKSMKKMKSENIQLQRDLTDCQQKLAVVDKGKGSKREIEQREKIALLQKEVERLKATSHKGKPVTDGQETKKLHEENRILLKKLEDEKRKVKELKSQLTELSGDVDHLIARFAKSKESDNTVEGDELHSLDQRLRKILTMLDDGSSKINLYSSSGSAKPTLVLQNLFLVVDQIACQIEKALADERSGKLQNEFLTKETESLRARMLELSSNLECALNENADLDNALESTREALEYAEHRYLDLEVTASHASEAKIRDMQVKVESLEKNLQVLSNERGILSHQLTRLKKIVMDPKLWYYLENWASLSMEIQELERTSGSESHLKLLNSKKQEIEQSLAESEADYVKQKLEAQLAVADLNRVLLLDEADHQREHEQAQ